jgi:hypothetical protein
MGGGNGGSRVEDGGWRMEDGGWRMERAGVDRGSSRRIILFRRSAAGKSSAVSNRRLIGKL